ncbi:MAG: sugar ABC transporter ATP-binding protein [Clostridia bacterium]|nr:sugar ABC transporter ATP-binding protein [Clostridia bacterium]
MKQVSKRFPGTLAVDHVDFAVKKGEVHALIGENGAGKSTLMKTLAGSYNDYTGKIFINSQEVTLHTPLQAKQQGIEMIYQEMSLAQPISIAENILVGRLPRKGLFLDNKKIISQSKKLLERVGLSHIDPKIPISEISQHEAQLVEIAKALGNDPHILVMDEPTSALSREEVNTLFSIINNLKQQGISIVYISHHLPEIFEVADSVTVMRDGKIVGNHQICDVTSEKLVEQMVGRSINEFYSKRDANIGEVMLSVKDLSRYGFFHNVSFDVHEGEIVGICGLAGSGRSELARSIVSADPTDDGEIYLEGKRVKGKNMNAVMREGIAYMTENRKTEGLALRMSVEENLLAAMIPELSVGLIYSRKRGKKPMGDLIEKLNISAPSTNSMVSNLSGGNQQKVLLAKWLAIKPRVLILDEPTRGVDIGAKMHIHHVIEDLANNGHAVIVISSDLPELVGLSDRSMIMRNGHFIGEIGKDELSEDTLLLAANGEGRS